MLWPRHCCFAWRSMESIEVSWDIRFQNIQYVIQCAFFVASVLQSYQNEGVFLKSKAPRHTLSLTYSSLTTSSRTGIEKVRTSHAATSCSTSQRSNEFSTEPPVNNSIQGIAQSCAFVSVNLRFHISITGNSAPSVPWSSQTQVGQRSRGYRQGNHLSWSIFAVRWTLSREPVLHLVLTWQYSHNSAGFSSSTPEN